MSSFISQENSRVFDNHQRGLHERMREYARLVERSADQQTRDQQAKLFAEGVQKYIIAVAPDLFKGWDAYEIAAHEVARHNP